MAADALSRPSGEDQGKDDNEAMVMIPESAFIRVMDKDSPGSLEECITCSQCRHQSIMKAWEARTPLLCSQTIDRPMWKTKDTLKLAIPPDPDLFCEIKSGMTYQQQDTQEEMKQYDALQTNTTGQEPANG
jgi:hypothetical protein